MVSGRIMLKRLRYILLCVVSPKWVEIKRNPLTRHLYHEGKKVAEQIGTLIVERNRAGQTRYLVDEGDGISYELPKERFYRTAPQVEGLLAS